MTKATWNAKDYAKQSTAQLRWAKELIEKMAISGHESILDVGCGDGKITAILADAVSSGSIIGTDLSQEMIDQAIVAHDNNHQNLSFQTMDAIKITFDNQFDIIFSNSTLHWVKDHELVLRGMYKALRQGGVIFLRFGGKGTLDSFQPMVDAMLIDPKWATSFESYQQLWWLYDDVVYTQWLKEQGFTPKSVLLIPSDMTYDERSGLEGWVRTTWHPYLNCLPEERKEEFITELVDRYMAYNSYTPEDKIRVKMIRLEVIAEKV